MMYVRVTTHKSMTSTAANPHLQSKLGTAWDCYHNWQLFLILERGGGTTKGPYWMTDKPMFYPWSHLAALPSEYGDWSRAECSIGIWFFTSIRAVSAIITLWTSIQSELLANPFFALLSILGAVDRTRGRQKARLEHPESYLIIGLSTHQCNIHSKPIITQLYMNHNWVTKAAYPLNPPPFPLVLLGNYLLASDWIP
jgi:hypothetical protein